MPLNIRFFHDDTKSISSCPSHRPRTLDYGRLESKVITSIKAMFGRMLRMLSYVLSFKLCPVVVMVARNWRNLTLFFSCVCSVCPCALSCRMYVSCARVALNPSCQYFVGTGDRLVVWVP